MTEQQQAQKAGWAWGAECPRTLGDRGLETFEERIARAKPGEAVTVPANITQAQANAAVRTYRRIETLERVLRQLAIAARTSGGTAGPDACLMYACTVAEDLLLIPTDERAITAKEPA